MAGWSFSVGSHQGLQDPLRRQSSCTQPNGGSTAARSRAAAATLASKKQLVAKNQVGRCSTLPGNPSREREFLAGHLFSCEPRPRELWYPLLLQHPTLHLGNRQAKTVLHSALDMEMELSRGSLRWSFPDAPGRHRPSGFCTSVTAETVSQLCGQGHSTEAVEALGVLVQTERGISKPLIYAVLKRCVVEKDLVLGRRVHAFTVKKGYQSDTFLGFHILRMYAAHGRLQDAMDVFTVVAKPDAFTWSAIISAHVQHGQNKQALQLYGRMRKSRVKPDGHVFVAALQACARGLDLKAGQQVHADVLDSGVEPDLFVCNCLVNMYAKCGSLEDAQRVFDGLDLKNVATWNAMIAGYSQQGMGEEALRLYNAVQGKGMLVPDTVTFVCLLQACASLGPSALGIGRQLHLQIGEQDLQADVVVANSLVNMYAKCGSLEDAQGVFDRLGEKNVVTWTALIAGYSQQGQAQEALRLYLGMQEEGIALPNSVTFVCLLHACADLGTPALDMGKQLDADIRERGLQADEFIASSLVNMYAKCGSLQDAQRVFDGLGKKEVVMWTALIAGYSQQGMGQEALHLYSVMQEEAIAVPNVVTFVCLLQACASVGNQALDKGKHLHTQIKEQGHEANVFLASSLVNMYAKCGSLEDSQRLFDVLGEKDVVTWNVMIAGYSQEGMVQEALHLYSAMQQEGIAVPDSMTFVYLLQACASVAALGLGKQLHAQIEEQGLQADMVIASSLINMYGKSGSLSDAQKVFDALPEKDVVTWNSLIAGYTCQGDSEVVFSLFQRMIEDGVQPVPVTFLSLLTVCSHVGLLSKGREYFEAMSTHYDMSPTADHLTCMVGLLGRAGQIDEAVVLVTSMPVLPDAVVWHTLLGACSKWGNVVVGLHAFQQVVKLDQKDPTPYVLMSNIYTSAQMWEQAEKMQARRLKLRAWKHPGQSWWTDKDGLVHTFLVGNENHPFSETLVVLARRREEGCVPSPASDPSDTWEEDLCRHSQKLAIARSRRKEISVITHQSLRVYSVARIPFWTVIASKAKRVQCLPGHTGRPSSNASVQFQLRQMFLCTVGLFCILFFDISTIFEGFAFAWIAHLTCASR